MTGLVVFDCLTPPPLPCRPGPLAPHRPQELSDSLVDELSTAIAARPGAPWRLHASMRSPEQLRGRPGACAARTCVVSARPFETEPDVVASFQAHSLAVYWIVCVA